MSYSKYKNNHTDLVIVVVKAQATDKSTWVMSRLQVDKTVTGGQFVCVTNILSIFSGRTLYVI